MPMTNEPAPLPNTPARLGCLPLLFVLLVVIAGAVRLVADLLAVGTPHRSPASAYWTLGLTFLFAVILGLLRWRAGSERLRALYNTWLLALAPPLLLMPTTWFLPVEFAWAALARVALLAVYALWVGRTTAGLPPVGKNSAALWAAAAAGALLAYPWVAWGTLGSLADTLLAILAATLFGWSAARQIAYFWLGPYGGQAGGDTMLSNGFVVAVALLLMVRNLGFNNGSLLLVLGMPWLGWLAVAVTQVGSNERQGQPGHWPALALVLSIATALPLAFADPDTLPLMFLFGTEGLAWGALAALVMAGVGLLLAPLIALLGQRTRGLWAIVALFCWLGGLVLYIGAGRPGLYGDRLFVILADQADVSAAAALFDYDERRLFVYRTLTGHALATQAALRRDLDRFGIAYTPYYLVNGLEVEGNLLVKFWLQQHPAVDRVLPAPILRPLPAPVTALGFGEAERPPAPPWHLDLIRAPAVWAEWGIRGAGVTIGQSDSGVQWDHPALADGYRGQTGMEPDHNYNWFDPWEDSRLPVDTFGHGTHTLGTALGDGIGVAPDASWFACRNLARNVGNAAYYLDCMQFMLAPFPLDGDPFRDGDPTRSAHVTNNSWGCPQGLEGCDANALLPAAEALRAAGIFTVVSAGNDGPSCSSVDSALALYDAVFTIGAINARRNLTSFSSVGPVLADGSGRIKPDLVAPGAEILSAMPGDGYGLADGTSSAGPHVAGVVALLWSANPALIGDIETTEEILVETAAPFTGTVELLGFPGEDAPCVHQGDVVPNNLAGYGIVDAYAAVARALELGNTNATQ